MAIPTWVVIVLTWLLVVRTIWWSKRRENTDKARIATLESITERAMERADWALEGMQIAIAWGEDSDTTGNGVHLHDARESPAVPDGDGVPGSSGVQGDVAGM
jgi:hypothetical protein